MPAWLEPSNILVPPVLADAIGGHPLVAQALARRSLIDPPAARAFLDPFAYTPASPRELPGLSEAIERLMRALTNNEPICVWGDFDVDGQTSTSLLVSALRRLGGVVSYHIPLRAGEGHGINLTQLEKTIQAGTSLLLTCDTGVSAHHEVAYAQSRGVDVIITDHHELTFVDGEPHLPPALAVVNPKRLPGGHPLSTLPGVGVAYKLVEALYQQAGLPAECEHFLDLVALGIVADVAMLHADARYLLQRGLQVLRRAERLAIQAMLERVELEPALLNEEHIAYLLAPRLNALGRLSDANPAVEFLTTADLGRARILALELEGLNARRKLLSDQVFQGALAQVEQDPKLLASAALVLSHPGWPAGVIGIVASRLVERFNRPVLLLSAPPGQLARGSARSVEGVDITAAIAAQHDLLAGFGGHPMAAGLSLDSEHIPEFRRRLSRAVLEQRGEMPLEAPLQIDAYVQLDELSLELAAELERLAPFGAGNPPPILASRDLHLVSSSPLGRDQEHLMMRVEDQQGVAQRLVWWQGSGWPIPQGRFDLAYTVRASTYRGQRDLQVEWISARPTAQAITVLAPDVQPIEVLDYRSQAYPRPILERLRAEGLSEVWCESEAKARLGGRDRLELSPAQDLVIWTAPPGPAELLAALQAVRPRRLILFGIDPGLDQAEPFLKRLAGVVKYSLSANQGQVSITSLAAATAQRPSTIRTGLAWLGARGHVIISNQEGDRVWLQPGSGLTSDQLSPLTDQLNAQLAESAAYRNYFARASVEALVPGV